MSCMPWKTKLPVELEDYYISSYLNNLSFKDSTLFDRVKVWQTVYKFFDLLFFKWNLLIKENVLILIKNIIETR